jgi:hypothetical protein
MVPMTDTVHAAQRFYQLADQCEYEASALVDHYNAGHVDAGAFDEISLLTSAGLRARRHGDALIAELAHGDDDNALDEADIVAEEITRLIAEVKPWRMFLDNTHRWTRRP